jgi:hypothetical protein
MSSSWLPCSTIRPWSRTTIRPDWRMVDRRWAMTIAGAPGEQPPQARLDRPSVCRSTFEVGLVEDEDPRVGDSARAKASSWRWPAESCTPRSPTSVRSPRAARRRSPTRRPRARGLDLGLVGVRAAEGDVVGDRAAEQERLLGHDPHLRAQRVRRHVAQVVAVDEHAPVGWVVEARDELGEGRLARARGADERHRLPWRPR